MAMTIPTLGKALDDLTAAYVKNNVKINELQTSVEGYTTKTADTAAKLHVKKAVLEVKDFLPEGVTLEAATEEQKEAAQAALDAQAEKKDAYHNALRNIHGSITVPEPVSDLEAANKKSVSDAINARIAELINNAPEEFDTLKELADALQANKSGIAAINTALANRYTKEESDAKFVEKETGKGLSSNDFTTAEKNKLAALPASFVFDSATATLTITT